MNFCTSSVRILQIEIFRIIFTFFVYDFKSVHVIFFCNESSYTQGNTTFFGSRCKLLGLLYGGPQHTSTGSVVFENIPTNPKAIIQIPNNLGVVVKAVRIKELEGFMKDMS